MQAFMNSFITDPWMTVGGVLCCSVAATKRWLSFCRVAQSYGMSSCPASSTSMGTGAAGLLKA